MAYRSRRKSTTSPLRRIRRRRWRRSRKSGPHDCTNDPVSPDGKRLKNAIASKGGLRSPAFRKGRSSGLIVGGSGRQSKALWRRLLFRPIDVASLVFLRIAFGVLMLWEVAGFFGEGLITKYWVEPRFHFQYLGFEWLHPLPGEGMYLLWAAMGVLALFIAAGYFYRFSASLFFLAYTYSFLLDQAAYQNHYYLICLISFLMIFVPANAAFSLDVKLERCRRRHLVPAWPRFLLCVQVAAVYVFGGIAKLNSDWLQGEPLRMWLYTRSDTPLIGALLNSDFMAYFLSYGGMVFDLAIVPLLVWKRTRMFAFLWLLCFHMINEALFDIGVFPALAIVLTTAFFDPDWPRRFIDKRWFKQPDMRERDRFASGRWQLARQWAVAGFVLLFLASQVLMPLRHHLYAGDTSWTEEGHRFSWRMKLRDKNAECVIVAVDEERRVRRQVIPRELMPEWQARKVASRPDMILQLSHRVADEMRKGGAREPSVYAYAKASLNGREPAFLVDPGRDLAKEKRALAPADWIAPLDPALEPGSVNDYTSPVIAGSVFSPSIENFRPSPASLPSQ